MKYLIIPLLLILSHYNNRINNLEDEIESINARLHVLEMQQNIKKEGVELSTLCKKLDDIVELPWEIRY